MKIETEHISVIDNFLDPPMHDAFDFCTRYYGDWNYGRTSADYEHTGESDSRYFSKIVYNGTPDPLMQKSFDNPGDEIFYRYVCGKLNETWHKFFTYDSSKFFTESRYVNFGLWVFDIHINFRSCSMTDQWHRDADPDISGQALFNDIPNWNADNRIGYRQFTFNLMLGNNLSPDETGFDIETIKTIPWKGNRMVVFPSEYPHKVNWKDGVNTKEMRMTYTMFGILIEYNLDPNMKPRDITGPIDQHDLIDSHNYKKNIERNKTKPNLFKT